VAEHEKPQKTWLWVLDFNYQLTNLPNYQIVGENGTAPIKARKKFSSLPASRVNFPPRRVKNLLFEK
jgi:hypothetical protein